VNLEEYGFQVAFKVETINVDDTRSLVHNPKHVDYAVFMYENNGKGRRNET